MRLLHTSSLELKEFMGLDIPPYVILSHTWGEEEVLYADIQNGTATSKKGYKKVVSCCQKAAQDGFQWAWIDTCCIDKASSAELSEAINSMYRWYEESTICYAYLQDVTAEVPVTPIPGNRFRRSNAAYKKMKAATKRIPKDVHHERIKMLNVEIARLQSLPTPLDPSPIAKLPKSRWFTRGWTLQELIAPKVVEFYTFEWAEIGTKRSLASQVSAITGIPVRILRGESPMTCSVAERMSWASARQTTREEDSAYCLLGLFGVHIPMLYGEGAKSFVRLQEQILKQEEDYSIFAWTLQNDCAQSLTGLLASSPSEFANTAPQSLQIPTLTTEESTPGKTKAASKLADQISDTFSTRVGVSGLDDFFGSTYQVLYTKNYQRLRRHNIYERLVKGALPQPPQLTSRGLRISLPIRRPKDSKLPVVAWIYCEIDNQILCILLRPLSTSPFQFGRHLSPWLISMSKSLLPTFTVTELYLHPGGLIKEEAQKPVMDFSLLSSSWGRVRVVLPETEKYTNYIVSAYPTNRWSLEEFFFRDEPQVIGNAIFECVHGQQSSLFIVSCGIMDGHPWCWVTEVVGLRQSEVMDELSIDFEKQSAQKPEFFSQLSDRAAKKSAQLRQTVFSAAIRRSPTTRSHLSVYTLFCHEEANGQSKATVGSGGDLI
ncbi:hypothetical protein EsH8_VII_000124 [Colletotrichum jinshuiense]